MIPKLTKDQFKEIYDKGFEATYALFDALQQAMETLEQRVAHLEAILAKDSHNSSKPPSSNGFKRPPQSLRGKSGKHAGGQNGHEGFTLRQTENPDHVSIHRCRGKCNCGRSLAEAKVIEIAKRQIIDLPEIKAVVTEHQAHTVQCTCGMVHKADFPDGINAPVQYGSGIKALAVYLIVEQLLPVQRTQQIFKDILGLELGQATLQNYTVVGYHGLEPTENDIKKRIVSAEVAHADETGCDVDKGLSWIHSLSTLEYTWYGFDKHRGKDALTVAKLIERFNGRLVHDGWKNYLHYVCKHALCNAHHLRELVFIDEHLKEGWAKDMKKLLLEIKETVESAYNKGKNSLQRPQQRRFRHRYFAIIRQGFAVQPPSIKRKPGQRGKIKQPPGKNLLDRLKNHSNEVLAFMYDFTVPFTNNLAERDLRIVKVKLKVSGCFRTVFGAQVFCRNRGFLSTVKKQNLGVMYYLRKVFDLNAKNVSLLPV
ncbi:MAG TPA: IS66 family transposase [Fibrobacteres bacterium]|nr:IS66 family transposase [Fibrobacterota bacterium]